MPNRGSPATPFQVKPGLLATGAVLAAVGSLLGLAGLVISGAALADAARRWVRSQEVPPTELAKQQLAKARAATNAGASAWRDSATAGAARTQ
jgi:hypothetical protein